MSIIVTHGLRNDGINPQHTLAGLKQIADIVLPYTPSLVLIGTGSRFLEMYEQMVASGVLHKKIPAKFCMFCGTADGFDAPNTIVLANGITCPPDRYMGLSNTPGFDAWKFVENQSHDTLFLAGGDLMLALGYTHTEKGMVYIVDAKKRNIDRYQYTPAVFRGTLQASY